MTTSFFQFLTERAQAANSLVCVGLDPRAETVGELRSQCGRIIDATADYAAAFKPNSAFFELHGPEGMLALLDVIASIPDDVPVILDAKRGDIGDTSEAYAQAAFNTYGARALTVSPYLGYDSIAPFIARREFGAFLLCKTSNPGADDIQSLITNSESVSEVVARLARQWNSNDNVGLVVGATYPETLARLRTLSPEMWFLVPGIGAQGADLEKTLAAGLRSDGLGLLINASRSIARAKHPGEEARRLRDEINQGRKLEVRNQKSAARVRSPLRESESPAQRASHYPLLISNLARDLIDSQCVRFGQFTLKSGVTSPIYLDLRRLISHPQILARAARAYAAKLGEMHFDRLAGIPYAGLPIATAVSLEMNRPLIYPRREAKDYGTKAVIEGDFNTGETIAVIDDLATTGGTKIESIQKLESAGLKVKDIVVLIDREQGAGKLLAEAGYRLHAVVTLRELLDVWRDSGAITAQQFDEVTAFLNR